MPSYTVNLASIPLSDEAGGRLAEAITRIHSDATGADGFLARVAFHELDAAACFLGGRRLAAPHCFIDARIRAGRSAEVRAALMRAIVDATTEILDVPRGAVWVYVAELPPGAMVEYGHTLPQPGGEAEWWDGLPEAERAFIDRSARVSPRS